MPRVEFDDGISIDFDTEPTPEDIEEAYESAKFGQGKPGNIPKSENILSRAVKAGGQALDWTPYSMLNKAKGVALEPIKNINRSLYGDTVGNMHNTVMDFATDPLTYIGGAGAVGGAKAAGKAGSKAIGKVFPYTSKEARVGFTKGVQKSLVGRRNALTRGFGRSLDKSEGIVDLSDILGEGPALNPELTKLTMKEAQDLKNAITSGIPESVKSGLRISPKHFSDRTIAGKIADRMKSADPGMASEIEKYGKHAENFKSAIAPIKGNKGSENIFGSNLVSQMFRGGGISDKSQVALQEFAPRLAKKVSKAKINENVFRGIRGATVGAALYNFVPNILRRAFLSEVSK